jgi:hypothetical protein
MTVTGGEIRDLLGEHRGIGYQLNFLLKSRDKLATQDMRAKERLWAYRCGLYDFRDAIQFHIELDERILQAFLDDTPLKNSREEHREIQKVIDELIQLADSAVIESIEPEELQHYAEKIGLAFNKTRDLIAAHIAAENALLQEALITLETAV